MPRSMRTIFWTVLCASALLVCALPAAALDQEYAQRYALPSGGHFSLENVNGKVEIEGWERSEVEVSAVKTTEGDQRELDRVRIEVKRDEDQLSVRTVYPDGQAVEVAVDYHIRVPRRVLLNTVETVNGSVRVEGIDGAGDLRSVNGNVEVLDSSGRFSEHTTNGNLRLELRHLAEGGPMTLETVNGSVWIGLAPGARAQLNVRSMNGDFSSELPLIEQGSYAAGSFRGRLGTGGSELLVRTVNGGVRIFSFRPRV